MYNMYDRGRGVTGDEKSQFFSLRSPLRLCFQPSFRVPYLACSDFVENQDPKQVWILFRKKMLHIAHQNPEHTTRENFAPFMKSLLGFIFCVCRLKRERFEPARKRDSFFIFNLSFLSSSGKQLPNVILAQSIGIFLMQHTTKLRGSEFVQILVHL